MARILDLWISVEASQRDRPRNDGPLASKGFREPGAFERHRHRTLDRIFERVKMLYTLDMPWRKSEQLSAPQISHFESKRALSAP